MINATHSIFHRDYFMAKPRTLPRMNFVTIQVYLRMLETGQADEQLDELTIR